MAMTAGDLAVRLGGSLEGDATCVLVGAAALEAARPDELAFVESARHLDAARASLAGCLLAPPDLDLKGRNAIRLDHPRLAFARAVELLHPEPVPPPGIHPLACVEPGAEIDPLAHVGPFAVVAARARIAAGAVVGPGSVIGEAVVIGPACRLVARVTIYPGTTLGARVLVHAGAVLGSDGFGFVRDGEGRLVKFRQIGKLEIGDDVEIGANVTIDRGALGATRIDRGTKLDNLVHVAHNVSVGADAAISAQVGIAGSSVVGERVTLAGQVGVADHVRIEDGAMVGAQAGISTGKIVRSGQVMWGTPARPLDVYKRQHAHLSRIAELSATVRELERRLAELERRGAPDGPASR